MSLQTFTEPIPTPTLSIKQTFGQTSHTLLKICICDMYFRHILV